MENQNMADTDGAAMRWAISNPGKLLTSILLIGSLGGSFSLSQWQISELRHGQEVLNAKIDTLPSPDWRHRVERLESEMRSVHAIQSDMRADVREIKTIVERLDKRM